jgi:hypothetical protein
MTSTRFKSLIAGCGALAMAIGGTACTGDDDADLETIVTDAAADAEDLAVEALEVAASNAAVQLAPRHFADAGHPISGDLSCSANAAGTLESVDIDCTGTTEAGDQARLTGTMDQLPDEVILAIDGQFTGTVDGQQVFETNRLGE